MNDYRYLDKGMHRFELDNKRKPRSKYKTMCPKCGDKKSFTPVIDVTTGQPVDASKFGVCDHEKKCGYSLWPSGSDVAGCSLMVSSNEVKKEFLSPIDPDITNIIPVSKMLQTSNINPDNVLFSFLAELYGYYQTAYVFNKYYVGTVDYYSWKGCSIFWQIDKEWRIRTGKILDFKIIKDEKENNCDVKRVKDDFPHIQWVHTSMGGDYALKQCLFGEHLLNHVPPSAPICIVEGEKTAIVGSLAYPNRVWMATGSLQNFREEVFKPLKGRKIIAFPDKGEAYGRWMDKTNKSLYGYNIEFNDFMEKKDMEEGADIADYLIKYKLNKKNTKG